MAEDLNELRSGINKISTVVKSVGDRLVGNETNTRTSLINPFLECLGYDVRNPLEVILEYTADIGKKRGEKVDYAVQIGEKIVILIEAKPLKTNLYEIGTEQLQRYFHTTEASIGILTDGQIYRFYVDDDRRNVMDSEPFFVFDVCKFNDEQLEQLTRFKRAEISSTLENLGEHAKFLKNKSRIKDFFGKEAEQPSREFVEFWFKRLHPNARRSQKSLDEFAPTVKAATKELFDEKVRALLEKATQAAWQGNEKTDTKSAQPEYTSTEEEIAAYHIVKSIGATLGCKDNLYLRAFQSYSRCIWDDSRNNKVVEFAIRGSQCWAKIFDESNSKGSEFKLDSAYDLMRYQNKIITAIKRFQA